MSDSETEVVADGFKTCFFSNPDVKQSSQALFSTPDGLQISPGSSPSPSTPPAVSPAQTQRRPHKKMSREQYNEMRDLFHMLDTDGSGTIDVGEIR